MRRAVAGVNSVRSSEDGSIRSIFSGQCLSIENCNGKEAANIVLKECHINDPQAQCEGKNQQWIMNASDQNTLLYSCRPLQSQEDVISWFTPTAEQVER